MFYFTRKSDRAKKITEFLSRIGVPVAATCACIKDRKMNSCCQPGSCPNGVYLSVPVQHSFRLYRAALRAREG